MTGNVYGLEIEKLESEKPCPPGTYSGGMSGERLNSAWSQSNKEKNYQYSPTPYVLFSYCQPRFRWGIKAGFLFRNINVYFRPWPFPSSTFIFSCIHHIHTGVVTGINCIYSKARECLGVNLSFPTHKWGELRRYSVPSFLIFKMGTKTAPTIYNRLED